MASLKSAVFKPVVGQGFKLAIVAVGIGNFGAPVPTRFLSSLLYGVDLTVPLTFIAVSQILTTVGLLACCILVRRARTLEPMWR